MEAVDPVVQIPYEELRDLTPGERAYGAVAITGIPNYAKLKKDAFRAGRSTALERNTRNRFLDLSIDLALLDAEGRKRSAAVNNTYPGWSGTPGGFGKGYDSGFTREDRLLETRDGLGVSQENSDASSVAEIPIESPNETSVKAVGHAGDGLASMRTHTTPVKTAGHAGDGLASMRTHTTPVKTAGHAGDGLASMRTHTTPVKSAGHAGDGLASMRTHTTPVKTAGHAGDGLASMRTHTTPVKTAGHAGDGLASMRTHTTPVKTAGHAGDGLASMRTHTTPVKTAGHAGDGLASMRTHTTPVKSAGHAGDGLASMRTHATPVKSAGHAMDGMATMQTPSAPVKPSSTGFPLELSGSLAGSFAGCLTETDLGQASHPGRRKTDRHTHKHKYGTCSEAAEVSEVPQPETDYWLPWHVDSNFVGDTTMLNCSDPDTLLLQMGAFAQIYTGGKLKACRHAVLNPVKPGVARFNYCNFWYVPWDTLCTAPEGMETTAVNKGWNAMMDESYLNITMKQSFTAFRQFMVSPEARVQFSDSQRFKELSARLPIVRRKQGALGALGALGA
eukprot:Skav212617  [mRNA]  locus=scaffold2176:305062:311042:- [translate_table: standard]